jgi:AcrR family transcriptional regulator
MAIRTTRQQILDAAQRLIEQEGFTRLTTKEIARESGFSEGTLFKHFARKEDLCLAVVLENSPRFKDTVAQMRAGQRTVQKNLEDLALAAMAFSHKLIPLAAALFADVKLLMRQREIMRAGPRGAGPKDALDRIAAYVTDEQELGRVNRQPAPLMVSAMIWGACFHRAFLRQAMGEHVLPMTDEQFARGIVATLMAGLRPLKTAARDDSWRAARRTVRGTPG